MRAAGATVAVNTRASRAAVEEVVAQIKAAGAKADLFMADIADAGQVQQREKALSFATAPNRDSTVRQQARPVR
jgi:hypothetical protein